MLEHVGQRDGVVTPPSASTVVHVPLVDAARRSRRAANAAVFGIELEPLGLPSRRARARGDEPAGVRADVEQAGRALAGSRRASAARMSAKIASL